MRRELTVWSNEWTIRAPHFLLLRHISRHVVHTSVRSLFPSLSPWTRPFPRAPLDPRTNVRKPGSFTKLHSRAPPVFLHFFSDSIHITTTNYTQPYGHPSLLAGLLNGYNLALFTTRAARSPVWQVSPRRSFLWEANRRRSLSSPASKSKIILSLGFLTAAINRSSEPCNTLSIVISNLFLNINNYSKEMMQFLYIKRINVYRDDIDNRCTFSEQRRAATWKMSRALINLSLLTSFLPHSFLPDIFYARQNFGNECRVSDGAEQWLAIFLTRHSRRKNL